MLTQPTSDAGDSVCIPDSNWRRGCRDTLDSAYGAAIVLSCFLIVIVLQLWTADLRVPFNDQADSILVQTMIKSIQENGWFLRNPALGGPKGSNFYDFPMSENWHFLVLKLLGYIIRPTGLLLNVYVLLISATACTTCFALRRLSISTGSALVGSLLFAFLPYHLLREYPHVFLASYYLVPLQILMCLRIANGNSLAQSASSDKFVSISRRSLFGMLLVTSLVSAGGVYYAFFGCFFLLLAGIYAAAQWGGWKNLAIACFLCGWTTVLTGANLAPSIIYHHTHGANVDAVQRSHFESEMFGMKLAQLLLPITNHRIKLLADLKDRYRLQGILINENDAASLGLIASIGFLLLLAQFLRRRQTTGSESPGLFPALAILNGGAVLLATVGGFGSIFSLIATPWIRGYNRISVYIGFFGIVAVLMLLEPVLARLRGGPARACAYAASLSALLLVGIYDQTSPQMIPNYGALKASFATRKNFVAHLEGSLPRAAMIFQLPYVRYPEAEGYCGTGGYDHLLPYLCSSSLRWSFGAVQGREGDSLSYMLATLPPAAMVEKLVLAGYEGLLIDRLAYSDSGQGVEKTFAALTAAPGQYSGDRRWVFFPLAEYRQ